jgi:hypothetical protein
MVGMRIRSLLQALYDDESGQGVLEYIMTLSAVVGLSAAAFSLLKPILERLRDNIAGYIDRSLFPTGEAMHQLRLKR